MKKFITVEASLLLVSKTNKKGMIIEEPIRCQESAVAHNITVK